MSRQGFLKAYSSPAVKHILGSTTPDHTYGPEDLAAIDKPTLLIWGEYDGLFLLEVGQAMTHHLARSRLVTVPEAGHAVHWEKPREVAAAIDRFRREGL